MDAIERRLVQYPAEVLAVAGAVVSVDQAGAVVVHRGLLREDQARVIRSQAVGKADPEDDEEDQQPEQRLSISEKLARHLSAHRTAALQAEVARHSHVALATVVHRLALRVILGSYQVSPVDIVAPRMTGWSSMPPTLCRRLQRSAWPRCVRPGSPGYRPTQQPCSQSCW